ncbi:SH3 domain-containing protein [uncultured Clostridium sp.]|uniref:N-acetylglucosaminidase n=1 Tax=uncultured Clostridium sp. TaxID=59620 RepID=UPI0026100174|nr:SH3 domain-containing protein [uncultured Clostridium sp.]
MKKRVITAAIATSTIIGLGIQNEKIAYGIDIQEKNIIQANNESKGLKGTIIDIKTLLRIRGNTDINSEILGYLENGREVEIVSKKDDWYEIIENNIRGYIHGDYVKINNKDVDVDVKKGKVINIASTLRIRETPSVDSEIKGYMLEGEEFNIEEKKGNWYKVRYKEKLGFIHGDYVKEIILKNENKIEKKDKFNSKKLKLKEDNKEKDQIYTNYSISLDEYAKIQNEKNPKYSVEYFKEYLNPNQENILQFLRIDKFRNINRSALERYLEKNNVGILKGQANALIVAAKNREIDPIYFTALSIYETAYGKKTLAKGLEVREIADLNEEIKNKKGELIGYKMISLNKPITVYNLYEIGAYENSKAFPDRELITAVAYAYNNGWTNISKAIDGAAEFISNNYIHNPKYEQNTAYKMRYINNTPHIWHQYATVPWYGIAIDEKMKEMENIYLDKNFIYDRPRFIEEERGEDLLNINLKINKNKLKQNEIHISIEEDMKNE